MRRITSPAMTGVACVSTTSTASMPRRRQTPNGFNEWLVVATIDWARQHGVERVSIVPGDTVYTPLRFDSYPISHSLLTIGLMGAVLGAVHFWRKRRALDALLLGLLAVAVVLLLFGGRVTTTWLLIIPGLAAWLVFGFAVCTLSAVLNTIHNILPDVPPQNIIAMFDTAYEAGVYLP